MKYSLIVDIGNSEIEFGLFLNDNLIDKVHFDTTCIKSKLKNNSLLEFLNKNLISPSDIEGGIIFSVVPRLNKFVQNAIKKEIHINLDSFDPAQTLNSIHTDIDNPNELGQDLIADIIGSIHEYGYPIVISDLGTVTKNIIIDKNGVFQGVSFFPGVRLNANILTDRTSLLPRIDNVDIPKNYFGKNTIEAMKSGIYYCHVAAIKWFMNQTEEKFGYKFKNVITGGFSNLFKNDFSSPKYIVDSNLVLKGMYLIFKNQKKL